MNYNSLMAGVILEPFTNTQLIKTDLFAAYARAYADLIYGEGSDSLNESTRNERKRKHSDSKRRLCNMFFESSRWNHLDDVLRLMDMFYSGMTLSSYLEDGSVGKFYIRHILNIAKSFITFRDGRVSIRNWSKSIDVILADYDEFEKIDLWNHITRMASVDIFIAAAYVNYQIPISNLYNVPNLVYLADMPLKVILDNGVADTHMHANAGISYQYQWAQLMKISSNQTSGERMLVFDESDVRWWFCRFYRLLAAMYLEECEENSVCDGLIFFDYIYIKITHELIANWFIECLQGYETKIDDNDILSYREYYRQLSGDKGIETDILYEKVYSRYRSLATAADIIFYYKLLKRLHQEGTYDKNLCDGMLMYIRYKNWYLRDKIQRTEIRGLDYFQGYYDRATELPAVSYNSLGKKNRQNDYYAIFEEQCKSGNLKIIELKISPILKASDQLEMIAIQEIKLDILGKIKDIIRAYTLYIQDHIDMQGSNFPNLGLVYHFIKQEDSDNYNGYNCFVNDQSYLIDCSDYNTMRRNCIVFLQALHELLQEYPLLTDYIVGIDAASIENATEPWVFAPVFRKARSSQYVIPYSHETRNLIQNIGFTYHVGEDFRHIVSGLRHIDEVLDHFDYHSGDRIGHAVALGINIDDWVAQYNMVAIPIMEYMENLLWMWKYVQSGKITHALDNLEYRIMEIAKQIYGDNLNGINVYLLWQVYQAKFDLLEDCIENRLSMLQDGKCKLLTINKKLPLINRTNKIGDENEAVSVWDFQTLLSTHYCPCYYEAYKKPIFVSTKEGKEFYKGLQKILINKVESLGIYVEANPSSNAIVSEVPNILNHPIVRINNRGLHIAGEDETCVLASINSDDPIVFSTFVENEIAYIYYSLINIGYKREEVLEWINKIRKHGVNSSFIKHKKNLESMMKDMEEILTY